MGSFGQQVRQIRERKGIGLNELAKELGVSPAYLSNLETGKTQTIQLEVLSTLQHKLHILAGERIDDNDDLFIKRIERVSRILQELYLKDAEAAEYLLNVVELGTEFFDNREPGR